MSMGVVAIHSASIRIIAATLAATLAARRHIRWQIAGAMSQSPCRLHVESQRGYLQRLRFGRRRVARTLPGLGLHTVTVTVAIAAAKMPKSPFQFDQLQALSILPHPTVHHVWVDAVT